MLNSVTAGIFAAAEFLDIVLLENRNSSNADQGGGYTDSETANVCRIYQLMIKFVAIIKLTNQE